MSNVDKQVPHTSRDSPYDPIVTSPIGKDKRQREGAAPFPSERGKLSSLALVFTCLQKILAPILSRAQTLTIPSVLLEHLTVLRKLLSKLADEDCSYQPQFNYQMAELWHIFLDDCNRLQPSSTLSIEVLDRIKFLISQIENFPIGSDYALGYYLKQEIGRDWNPFPCMQLFKELHDEFVRAPSQSTLYHWILLIDEI
ncbi:MAG: hypothetical protein RLZZ453_1134 [Chlamydiota bacterium]|jgi:hypothetical protein